MNEGDLVAELKEQTRWLRILALQQVRPLLHDTLDKPEQRLVYELSDGKRTAREVAKAAGIKSHTTVTRYWDRWAGLGIMEESSRKGRKQRVVSLLSLGIPVELPKEVDTDSAAIEDE